MRDYYLLLKDSKTAVTLYGELKKFGIKCTMAPTPRLADACCGVSILYYNISDTDIIKKIVEQNNIEISKFWDCEKNAKPNRNKFC